jgi:hypothetical protein
VIVPMDSINPVFMISEPLNRPLHRKELFVLIIVEQSAAQKTAAAFECDSRYEIQVQPLGWNSPFGVDESSHEA